MKLLFISFVMISQNLLAMGDPYFLPANPPKSKSLPDIRALKYQKSSEVSKQAQEEKKQRSNSKPNKEKL